MKFPSQLYYILKQYCDVPCVQVRRCGGTCFQEDLCRLVLLGKLAYYKICCFLGHSDRALVFHVVADNFQGGLKK